MTGSIQGPPFLSAYLTVEEAGHKYGGGKGAICIRGLKWTWRGQEEVERKKRGNKGSREEGEREEAHEDLGRRREDHQGQALSC